jgi:hypothetical protein
MFHLIGPLLSIALGVALLSAARAVAVAIGASAIAMAAQTHRSHRLPGWFDVSPPYSWLAVRAEPRPSFAKASTESLDPKAVPQVVAATASSFGHVVELALPASEPSHEPHLSLLPVACPTGCSRRWIA